MAIIANTFLTFSAIGNREDLSDTIYNISPIEVPFQSMIGKSKATATLHEWQTDSLAAAAANAQLQGDDVSFAAAAVTARINNRTQVLRKETVIAATQEAVNKAGRKSEMVYQLQKRSKELKRDLEFVLCSNQAPVTGNSTTAPQMRPLVGWFTTNTSRGVSGVSGTTSAAATDGTQRAVSETLLQDAMQNCWVNGGNPGVALTGPKQKRAISAFTGGATKFDKTEDKTLYAVVDVYVSDFGQIKLIPSRFTRGASTAADREVFVLDTDYWALATLRPMQTVDLAKTGDADKAMIITEVTLESRNEAASAVIADLT
jgi:acid stress-induced BolA-like protein IbaG/YrbA